MILEITAYPKCDIKNDSMDLFATNDISINGTMDNVW